MEGVLCFGVTYSHLSNGAGLELTRPIPTVALVFLFSRNLVLGLFSASGQILNGLLGLAAQGGKWPIGLRSAKGMGQGEVGLGLNVDYGGWGGKGMQLLENVRQPVCG